MKEKEIIKKIKENEFPKQGVISIYGSFLGKPGDTMSYIKNISMYNNSIIIDLGKEKIFLEEVTNVIINKNIISIENSKNVKLGNKIFQHKENEKSFVLYTW